MTSPTLREVAREFERLAIQPGDALVLRGEGWKHQDLEGITMALAAHLDQPDSLVIWLAEDSTIEAISEQVMGEMGWQRIDPAATALRQAATQALDLLKIAGASGTVDRPIALLARALDEQTKTVQPTTNDNLSGSGSTSDPMASA